MRIAAANVSMQPPRYCRRLLTTWLGAERILNAAPQLVGRFEEMRIPVSEEEHRALRVAAAEHDASVNDIVLRILHQACPHEVEVLAAVLGE